MREPHVIVLAMRATCFFFFFFQAEDGIRDVAATGVQTCALPISLSSCHGSSFTTRSRSLRSRTAATPYKSRSEEHTSELQSRLHLVCRLLLEKKKTKMRKTNDTIKTPYVSSAHWV